MDNITRTLEEKLSARLYRGKVIILYGPRQVGKTTLIHQLLENRPESYILFNGDEADIREQLQNTTSTRLKSLVGNARIVFIDEAQRIPGIGLTLKLFADQLGDIQVIATGSSAFELAGQTSEPLTGRKYEYHLYPLTFQELAVHNGFLEEHRLRDHRLIFGSYPEIVTKPGEERELIKLLAESYLFKDLLALGTMKKPYLLSKIIRALALQVGQEVSYREIGLLVGADNQTIERYIDLLEKAFVIFQLPAFSRNVRNEIKKGRKIYFYDNGIRNAIISNFNVPDLRSDVGALWENYLISERKKWLETHSIDYHGFFWRTTQQQEIDYIEERNGNLYAYEFKWNPHTKRTIPKTFSRNYPNSVSSVITPKNYTEFLLNL
ncbi:MAG: ATP-binding protein [FCB group bacterium]|nr:ATP-binding protein [FCB group bacterium]